MSVEKTILRVPVHCRNRPDFLLKKLQNEKFFLQTAICLLSALLAFWSPCRGRAGFLVSALFTQLCLLLAPTLNVISSMNNVQKVCTFLCFSTTNADLNVKVRPFYEFHQFPPEIRCSLSPQTAAILSGATVTRIPSVQ